MPQKITGGQSSSTSKLPKDWPQDIVYLRAPVYSRKLAPESLKALTVVKADLPPSHQLYSTNNPTSSVKIVKITTSSHPANGQHGLFTNQSLLPDSFILSYLGYVHDTTDTNETSDYDLSLDREFAIGVDASSMGNEARFINDYRGVAGAPNAEFRDIYVDLGNGKVEKRMGVFVLSAGKSGKRAKGIPKDQEILVSYGKGFWTERNKTHNVE
ncbi:hypothetical protein K491DRAFT_700852 [Lophiostoma macrostomum CBS 122681]|uniref:SET domain-containing protein n=1 Tax=Lophiostoma macrostomum CBS 122681 TaxID=1314788 RepID=A0A6A6TPW2_9PLEO|nr:hypothetical protein K491DRAFT_700852 [Lophiostoma macrostomum CBS 122681]